MKPNPSTPFVNDAPVSTGNPMPVTGSITAVVDESTLATQTTLAAVLAKLPADPATQTTLAAILAALQAQRAETLWTDDTLAYFVRVDANGSISWKDISGNSASAPGTGARPVSGPSAVIDKSAYQAIATATGYTTGDLLDHVIITDPTTGTVIGHFWINTTTELKLASSPASGNITPLQPLPTGAATASGVAALLSGIVLAAGSAVIGKVGIDQTTPGTTNGVVLKDSSGAVIGYLAQVLSGAGWSVPQAGFSNPQYIAANATDSTGFDISAWPGYCISFEGTYAGAVVAHQQTNDPAGLTGWFNVTGFAASNTTSTFPSSGFNTSGAAIGFPRFGQRARVVVTAISSGTITARVNALLERPNQLPTTITVVGVQPHGGAINGSPARIGGRARAPGAPYTALVADNVADLVTDLLGNLKVTQSEFSNANITTNTTTTVKSGAGSLRGITVNTKGTVASTVTIYDNTAGSGTKIGTIDSLNLAGQFVFDVAFGTGLTIVTTGAPDISVAYR